MSIIGPERYNDYVLTHAVPQWAKLERYEYCEPFFDTISTEKPKKSIHSLMRILTSLFL